MTALSVRWKRIQKRKVSCVIPGDRLRLETEIIKCKGPMGIGKAVATVDGKLAAEAEISFMCTDAK